MKMPNEKLHRVLGITYVNFVCGKHTLAVSYSTFQGGQ
jgi:hypothetical protein